MNEDNDNNDRNMDVLAGRLASQIISKPDFKKCEYLGVIYKDAQGDIKVSRLYTDGKFDRVNFDQLIPEIGSYDNIIGVVHNHPVELVRRMSSGQAGLDINKLPSNGDWSNAERIFGERSDVSYYVLGPDDVLRRYEYTDREKWDKQNEIGYWRKHEQTFRAGPKIQVPEKNDAAPGARLPEDAGMQPSDTPSHNTVARHPEPLVNEYVTALQAGNEEAARSAAMAFAASERGRQLIAEAEQHLLEKQQRLPGRDNPLFQQALDCMQRLGPQAGGYADLPQMDSMAGAIACQASQDRLTRIESIRLLPNGDYLATGKNHNNAFTEQSVTDQGAAWFRPLQDSLQQLDEQTRSQQQEQQQTRQQQQADPFNGPVR